MQGDFTLRRRRCHVNVHDGTRLRISRSRCHCGATSARLGVRDLRDSSTVAIVHERLLQGSQRQRRGGLRHSLLQVRRLIMHTPASKRLDFIGIALNRRITTKRGLTRMGIVSRFGIRTSLDRCCMSQIAMNLPTSIACRKGHCTLGIDGIIPRIGSHAFSISLIFAKRVPRGIHLKGDFQMRVRLKRPRRTLMVPHNGFCSRANKR